MTLWVRLSGMILGAVLVLVVEVALDGHTAPETRANVAAVPAPSTPRIVAEGTWDGYAAPAVTIRAPARHHIPVVSRRDVPARADLGTVFASGLSVVGTPYVAGGASPAGFDCSGFVAWAYAQAGISLPRTVGGIRSRLTVIRAEDAQPGDVLAWPGHVALYAGPGLRLDANRPGSTVQVRAIYGSPVYIRY